MKKRRLIFQAIVGAVVLLFLSSAVFSVWVVRTILSWKLFSGIWLLLTVLGQGPFLMVPIDRGHLLRFSMERLPQWVTQLMLTISLTNLIMLLISPLLLTLSHPNKVYDYAPFALLTWVGLIVFRSATRVVERRFTIPVEGLSSNWRNLTILHISDVHAGPFLRKERLESLVNHMNDKGGFDVCVITGDVVNHNSDDLLWALPILEKIQAPMGTFATMGNHEYIDDEHKIIKIYEKSSVVLLRDNSVLLSDGRHNLRLIGVDYPFDSSPVSEEGVTRALKRSVHYSEEIEGEMKVLLSHHPNGFVGGRRVGVPLTLSGHTHGGQVIVFKKNIIGFFMRYKRGIYRKGNKYLYVNSGLGNWMPFRINCPCEFALITIMRKTE